MGEKMTLTEVRDWLREAAKHDGSETTRRWYGVMADAIDAHLTQPAQAVNVVAIREVIADIRHPGYRNPPFILAWADKLTAALTGKQP